jgi:K+-sensing histidine kinase KdpD
MTGLGLGLYFCKRIIEDHGGRIALRSTPGEGSEFEVRLPMSRALPVAAHPETSEAPALQVTPSMQQATT